jgi:histidine triad (HIT) family protein
MASIFTRIIAGEIPGQFVFKDPLWVALLDIAPANPGHLLLVPRAESALLAELPAATLDALGGYLARALVAVRRATRAPAVNVVVNDGPAAGQLVPHAHLHIIPRFPGDGKFTHAVGGSYDAGELQHWGDALRQAWV